MNTTIVASNFVDTQERISSLTYVAAIGDKNEIERNLRLKHIESLKNANTLRLLVLTKNLTPEDYEAKARVEEENTNRLAELIWVK
jgi:hypothetical protein